jgi:hypothetical protein
MVEVGGKERYGAENKERMSMEGKRYIMKGRELCMYKRKSLAITIPKGRPFLDGPLPGSRVQPCGSRHDHSSASFLPSF